MFLLFVALGFIIQLVSSHPQCVDSHPPFRPKGRVSFCKQYSRLGCCTKNDDASLKILYENALGKVQNWRKCKRFLLPVVCLKCHSWSAHLFNAESNLNFSPKFALPCLGRGYCSKLMTHCKEAVEHIWGKTMKARNVTMDNFCQEAEKAFNTDLCYPKIRRTIKRLKNAKLTNTAKGSNKGCLCVKEIARDLRNPLALVHANDGTHRMFVAEQVGVVHVILRNGTKLDTPFMNITKQVLTSPAFGDERGFLGIVFHPMYRYNGRLFIYYNVKSRKDHGDFDTAWWLATGEVIILSEWRVSKTDPNQVDPTSEKIILTLTQPAGNHNGGQLLFGDDNLLYIFPGDGGKAGDPFGQFGNALNKSSLLGKVLRIDIDHQGNGKNYTIPKDNPFIKERTTRPEIYAYGARNMWRCSVDRGERRSGYGKGRMFCGDVGQDKYEEIDIIKKGGNYGWRGREGYQCYDKKLCKSSLLKNEILPIHVYDHKVGQSIVGGYVYRGCNYPNMRGFYFFADTMNGRMFTLKENKRTKKWLHKEVCMGDKTYCVGPKVSGSYAPSILSFGEDESGELYVLSTQYANTEQRKGAVYRLIDPERRTDPSECRVTVKKPAKHGCKDRRKISQCQRYEKLHFCSIYEDYMTRNCRNTCDRC